MSFKNKVLACVSVSVLGLVSLVFLLHTPKQTTTSDNTVPIDQQEAVSAQKSDSVLKTITSTLTSLPALYLNWTALSGQ